MKKEANMEMNSRLKEVRIHLRLNQRAMADKLGYAQSYYSDVENCRRRVTTRLIDSLLKLFGVSPDWMYSGLGSMITIGNAATVVTSESSLKDVLRPIVKELVTELFNQILTSLPIIK